MLLLLILFLVLHSELRAGCLPKKLNFPSFCRQLIKITLSPYNQIWDGNPLNCTEVLKWKIIPSFWHPFFFFFSRCRVRINSFYQFIRICFLWIKSTQDRSGFRFRREFSFSVQANGPLLFSIPQLPIWSSKQLLFLFCWFLHNINLFLCK